MRRFTGCIALLAACASTAAGCEDSQARRRAEVQETINAASGQLREVMAVRLGPPSETDAQRKLNRIIADLSNTSGGEPGQQSAASRLAASAHRTLASLDVDQARGFESDNRSRRSVVHGMIDAAIELNTLATALESVSADEHLTRLAEAREASQEVLRDYSVQVASRDGPIGELNRENRNDRSEVDRLRDEADNLRRDAADLGPANGYRFFALGLQLDREADRIEHEIAQRELKLRFDLLPEHERAQAHVTRTQALIETIEEAEQSLETVTASTVAEGAATRESLTAARQRIAAALTEIDQTTAGELTELYDRAASNLEKAASKAGAAARYDRSAADSARIEGARSHQELGDLHRARARGMADQIVLLERLAAASEALGDLPAATEDVRQPHQEAMEQARKAYGNAQNLLNQVSGRTARRELEAVKAGINALLSEAPQGPSDVPRRRAAAPVGTSGAGTGAPAGGDHLGAGAESPQALLAALSAASDLESSTSLFVDYTYVELKTPAEEALHRAMMESMDATIELERALQERFGSGMLDLGGQAMGAGMGGGSEFAELGAGDVKLGPVVGDRGTINITAEGQREQISIVRINGRWYLDGTEQFAATGSMGEGMPPGGPEATTALIRGMSAAMANLAQRVRAGEFGSTQQAMMAMMQEMQRLMQHP